MPVAPAGRPVRPVRADGSAGGLREGARAR